MYKLQTTYRTLLADTTTPVSIYLRLRDRFPNTVLLESSDHRAAHNNFSFIACKPIAGIKLQDELFSFFYPDGKKENKKLSGSSVQDEIMNFLSKFKPDPLPLTIPSAGLF